MDSFLAWILNAKKSIAYRLVDAGYDVWMNNTRGNRFSQEHQFLDIKHWSQDVSFDISPELKKSREKFWKFSFHEMAIYD